MYRSKPQSVSLSLSQTSQYFWYQNLWAGRLKGFGLELSYEEKVNIVHWSHADLSSFRDRATIFLKHMPGRWMSEAYCNLQKIYNSANITKYAKMCPMGCGKTTDLKADHAFNCAKLPHRTYRHHQARRDLTDFITSTGEKPVFSQDDRGQTHAMIRLMYPCSDGDAAALRPGDIVRPKACPKRKAHDLTLHWSKSQKHKDRVIETKENGQPGGGFCVAEYEEMQKIITYLPTGLNFKEIDFSGICATVYGILGPKWKEMEQDIFVKHKEIDSGGGDKIARLFHEYRYHLTRGLFTNIASAISRVTPVLKFENAGMSAFESCTKDMNNEEKEAAREVTQMVNHVFMSLTDWGKWMDEEVEKAGLDGTTDMKSYTVPENKYTVAWKQLSDTKALTDEQIREADLNSHAPGVVNSLEAQPRIKLNEAGNCAKEPCSPD